MLSYKSMTSQLVPYTFGWFPERKQAAQTNTSQMPYNSFREQTALKYELFYLQDFTRLWQWPNE